jgi:hypothetical protein
VKALSRLYRPRHARIASITAARAICPCPRHRQGSRNSSAEPKSWFELRAPEDKRRTPHLKTRPEDASDRTSFAAPLPRLTALLYLIPSALLSISFCRFLLLASSGLGFDGRAMCKAMAPTRTRGPLERRHRRKMALLRASSHWATRARMRMGHELWKYPKRVENASCFASVA